MRYLVLASLVLFACSNRLATEKAEDLTRKTCSCAEVSCADAALKEFRDWFAENTPQGSRRDAETVADAYEKAEACAGKLRAAPVRL